MFRNKFWYLTVFLIIGFLACSNQEMISGQLHKAAGKEIALNKIQGSQAQLIGKKIIDDNGEFTFDTGQLEPGMYSLNIENRIILLALDGTEKAVTLTGSYAGMNNLEYTVEGSAASRQLQQNLRRIMNQEMEPEDFKQLVENEQMLEVAATLTMFYLPFEEVGAKAIHQTAKERVERQFPGSRLAQDYENFIKQNELLIAQRAQQLAASPVQIGDKAPEIALPNPQGKILTLSKLRGKVVILDFWASWCAPCRRFGNPELVRLYREYKDKDFAIFNVALERSPDNARWVNAIEADRLVWPFHVVDRTGEAMTAYGVDAIPRTFVLDKEGKIAAINPHGPELEATVKELLTM